MVEASADTTRIEAIEANLQAITRSDLLESLERETGIQEAEARRRHQGLSNDVARIHRITEGLQGRLLWLMLSAFVLLPISLFLLGWWLAQRFKNQHDELKRQRLRLEGVEDSLRHLPGNLPSPTLDTSQVADRLRDHLGESSRLSTDRATPASGAASPFFQNDEWIPKAVEGPRQFLDSLADIRERIGTIYDALSEAEDPGESLALMSWILSRFHHKQASLPQARWRALLQAAEESGYICDLSLSERLQRTSSPEEGARTIHRALYRDVLEQSISDHLILVEELRHLPNFCGALSSHDGCQAIADQVNPMVETLLTKTRRLAGYTPNYVPLFSDFTDTDASFVRNNASKQLPRVYRHLDLPRRQILCVLAYGLRRERGWENEETQVILS